MADYGNNRIRKITLEGASSLASGFNKSIGVAVHEPDSKTVKAYLYVADSDNHLIRKVTSGGTVSTFAGSTEGFADGTGTAAQFNHPSGVAVDSSGSNTYVADWGNIRIRKIEYKVP